MGAMSLLVLFAQRTRRMFDMYFSIVRRSAACASRLSASASWMTTTGGVGRGKTAETQRVGAAERGAGRTFEPLPRAQVDLLCLCDLLQDLLDDHPVIRPDLTARPQYPSRSVLAHEKGEGHTTHLGVISMW